jgi:hypothetical protein
MLLAVALALFVQSPPLAAIDVRQLVLSPPARVLQVSVDALKGDPDRLAWSPDGQHIYLRAAKVDRWGNRRVWHYQVDVEARQLREIAREPDWCGRYWTWKSALAAPAMPDLRIALETRQERKTATGIASAGAMAQSGGDPSLGSELGPQGQAIASAAMQGQTVTTTTMRLRGELLGEFVNTPAAPGLTFGWAPASMSAIVYADGKGRLVLMDRAGRKREIPAVRDAYLPAWSDNGTRMAWVQREAGKKVAVVIVSVDSKQ